MNEQTDIFDKADEEILTATGSDEALEAAAGPDDRGAAPNTLFTMSWFHCSIGQRA